MEAGKLFSTWGTPSASPLLERGVREEKAVEIEEETLIPQRAPRRIAETSAI